MIEVDRSFYENGCTMDGKGNRVFLKGSNGNVEFEMEFVGNTIKVYGPYIPSILYFQEIEKISVTNIAKEAYPIIKLKH